ncbi:MAG: sigma-70 family RNA polymerase sigma factor [Bacteroidota bacterium]
MKSGQQTIHKYLINRSQEGDRKAQNELYKLYAGAMYNICRRMMGDEEEAKDVLQDAFVTAFTRISSLKNEVTFSAWLKRIVINHCINCLKKKRHYVTSLEENVDVAEEDNHGFDGQEFEVKRVMKAIDQISEGCRTVLNLYLFEGYDHKEIGQILSITESASKAQYSKAKSKIRKILTA